MLSSSQPRLAAAAAAPQRITFITCSSSSRSSSSRRSAATMAPASENAPVDQADGPLPAIPPPPLPQDAAAGGGKPVLRTSRQGSVEPYTVVEGPEAWYGEQYQHNFDSWAQHVTDTQAVELEVAVARVLERKTITQEGNYLHLVESGVSKEDFELPTLGPVLRQMQQEALRGRGFGLLRGLPVGRWTRAQTIIATWGIGLHWGAPRRQNEKGHLIGHVKDVGVDSKHRDPATRIYLTSAAQPWHVDGSDLVGLLCLRAAKSGGLSSVASSVTVHNELLKRDPGIVRTLAGTWYLDRKGEVPAGKLPYHVLPVVTYHQGYLSTSFNDTYYQLAAAPGRHGGQVPPLTPAQLGALAAFREVADQVRLEFELLPGDLQLVHNHSMVHMRTAYEDHEGGPDQRRHLLRLWVAPPGDDGAFPLHPAYAELWHSTAPGERGGIYVEGYRDVIPLEAEVGNKLAT